MTQTKRGKSTKQRSPNHRIDVGEAERQGALPQSVPGDHSETEAPPTLASLNDVPREKLDGGTAGDQIVAQTREICQRDIQACQRDIQASKERVAALIAGLPAKLAPPGSSWWQKRYAKSITAMVIKVAGPSEPAEEKRARLRDSTKIVGHTIAVRDTPVPSYDLAPPAYSL
jgi:hypothetical protein